MMAKFTLASNHLHDKDAIFSVVWLGKKADFVEKYVKKGIHLADNRTGTQQ